MIADNFVFAPACSHSRKCAPLLMLRVNRQVILKQYFQYPALLVLEIVRSDNALLLKTVNPEYLRQQYDERYDVDATTK